MCYRVVRCFFVVVFFESPASLVLQGATRHNQLQAKQNILLLGGMLSELVELGRESIRNSCITFFYLL